MVNSKSSKKTNNATIRKQEECKEMLINVIKRSKTVNKLNNAKIRKKLLSKAKRTTEKRFKKIVFFWSLSSFFPHVDFVTTSLRARFQVYLS